MKKKILNVKHFFKSGKSGLFNFCSIKKSLLSIENVLKSYSQEFSRSQAMENIIPRKYTNEALHKISNNLRFTKDNNHIESLTKTFSIPIWDLLDRGGKRWRPILCMLIAQLYDHKKEEIYPIAALCEIVHNGTLLVDDIQDSSSIRRNKPCVHLIYGTDVAINAGNFMYYAPMLSINKGGCYSPFQLAKLNEIYIQEMVQLHIGQGWDILWHNINQLEEKYPTQDQYLQMTAHKTGVLARMAARMVCAIINVPQSQTQLLIRFVENLGVAFQIQDDLLNLEGEEFKNTKGYNGEDIHEGKITLMVIHHLGHAIIDHKERLLYLLMKKTQNTVEINEAIALLRESGSLQYARAKMYSLIEKSCIQIEDNLPANPVKYLLKELAQFGIKRQR